MDANVAHHPSLVALLRRVRLRRVLERVRIGLLMGLAGGTVVSVVGRVLAHPEWLLLAAAWIGLALGVSIASALVRRPGRWEAARAADGLGLKERVTSALHAAEAHHPAAPLVATDAAAALSRIDPACFPLVPQPRGWRPVLLATLALAAVLVAPIPPLGDAGRRAAEAQTVAASRRSVQELQARMGKPAEPEALGTATAAELAELEERLSRARDAAEAARTLEQAQERLAALATGEDYAWQRAAERLAAGWSADPELGAVGRALGGRDPQAVAEAMAELEARAAGMTAEERQQLDLALQAGANAARDVPDLAAALRRAATRADGGPEGDATATGEGGLGSLAPQLAQAAARSAGLQATQQAVAGLGQARAAVGAASSPSAGAAAAAPGSSGGGASGGQAGAAGGAGSGAASGSAGGQGSGAGGEGAGSGTGSGAGSGSGSGSASGGTGGAGAGVGAGAGAGGGASPGMPGAGGSGATTTGGSGAPNLRGATGYDPVYAPSLLGGEGGPRTEAPGDAAGAGGDTVETPDSPLELGAVRPYDEVYGRYESSARESLARQPLPPSLQGLVQRYFSAIDPGQ